MQEPSSTRSQKRLVPYGPIGSATTSARLGNPSIAPTVLAKCGRRPTLSTSGVTLFASQSCGFAEEMRPGPGVRPSGGNEPSPRLRRLLSRQSSRRANSRGHQPTIWHSAKESRRRSLRRPARCAVSQIPIPSSRSRRRGPRNQSRPDTAATYSKIDCPKLGASASLMLRRTRLRKIVAFAQGASASLLSRKPVRSSVMSAASRVPVS